MEIYWILGAALVAALFFFVSIFFVGANTGRNKPEEQKTEVVEEDANADVLRIVRDAFISLTRQKAAGYGPWLSACLSRPGTTPGVALEALRRVRSELTGLTSKPRFDLNELGRAILALEVKMGEWG